MLKQNKFLTAILIKFFIVNFTEIAHKSNGGFIEYWRQTTYLQNVMVGLQSVFVCVWERERKREREKEHEKEREWERERKSMKRKENEREREKEHEKEREWEREKDWTWILHEKERNRVISNIEE